MDSPFVVLLEENGAGEPGDGGRVREDADDFDGVVVTTGRMTTRARAAVVTVPIY